MWGLDCRGKFYSFFVPNSLFFTCHEKEIKQSSDRLLQVSFCNFVKNYTYLAWLAVCLQFIYLLQDPKVNLPFFYTVHVLYDPNLNTEDIKHVPAHVALCLNNCLCDLDCWCPLSVYLPVFMFTLAPNDGRYFNNIAPQWWDGEVYSRTSLILVH